MGKTPCKGGVPGSRRSNCSAFARVIFRLFSVFVALIFPTEVERFDFSEECDTWNIQATFLDPLPSNATDIMADSIEIGVKQLEAARTDGTRTAVTIRTQQKSRLQPGELIHLGFEQASSA